MATSSISGLASGLDTAGIVSQLMRLEAAGQSRLKTKLSAEQSTLKAIQDLNTKFSALTTSMGALAKPGAWSPLTATSSHEGVTVKATSGSSAGSLTLSVDKLAQAHTLRYADTATMTDVVVPPDADGKRTLTLAIGGETKTLDTGDGTLAGLVNALNASGTGVRASTLKLDGGDYRVTVQAAATGAASSFTLTAGDGSALLGGGATVVTAQDAAVTIGSDTVHSSTNTFTGLLPGVDVTVTDKALGKSATIEATGDATAARTQAKAMVDQVNELLTQLDKVTAYDATTKKSGALGGNNTVRELRTKLLEAVYPATGTMAGVGVQTDRYGKLVFDPAAFDKAFAADATGTAAAFSATSPAGFAQRLEAVGKDASHRTTGTLTTLVTGSNANIDQLEDSIAAWDTRLELREKTLTRQFTALETALSRMNSQSSWLSGQLGSMNSQ